MIDCGIYRIINIRNGKFYIGSSKNLSKRKSNHFSELSGNRHPNIYLQNAYHNQPWLGKKRSNEDKEKMSLGRRDNCPVIRTNINTGYVEYFRSKRHASRLTGTSRNVIKYQLNKDITRKPASGYKWSYANEKL